MEVSVYEETAFRATRRMERVPECNPKISKYVKNPTLAHGNHLRPHDQLSVRLVFSFSRA